MSGWCEICCTKRSESHECPGDLRATGDERHGWRINVETPQGVEAYGVLVAETSGPWRARILTYPNILWLVPGGRGTIKFAGDTPREAEQHAIRFIREHCRARGYQVRQETAIEHPGSFDSESMGPAVCPRPAERKVRFLPLRFGVAGATEPGGTGNLSETGLFIITNLPLKIGSELEMLLNVNQKPVALSGRVCWMRKNPHVGRSPGMGVQLTEPPRLYVDYVRSLT